MSDPLLPFLVFSVGRGTVWVVCPSMLFIQVSTWQFTWVYVINLPHLRIIWVEWRDITEVRRSVNGIWILQVYKHLQMVILLVILSLSLFNCEWFSDVIFESIFRVMQVSWAPLKFRLATETFLVNHFDWGRFVLSRLMAGNTSRLVNCCARY